MSDTPTPEAGTLEGHIKDFVEMDLQIADLRATLAAKDRLLERMAGALRLLIKAGFIAEETDDIHECIPILSEAEGIAREALKEYAEIGPIPLDPAPAPQ